MTFALQKKSDITSQLAKGKILPLLIRLSIPATLAQLVNALYSIVDRMYIGHMPGAGALALGGVGLTFPMTMLMAAFSCLPGLGGTPLAGIALGRGDKPKAQQYLNNAFTMLLVISLALTAVFLIFLEPLLLLFGADAQTLPYARDYLQIYLLGTLFVELALGLNPFINSQGFTAVGTMSVVIGAVLNIALDPLFIYTLGMGVRGAALATVIAQMVSCGWIFLFLTSKRSILRIRLKDMKIDLRIWKECCALGVSTFTFRVNESIVVVALNHLLLHYGGAEGNLHIASMAILSSVSQVFFMPLSGIVTGAQPLLSFNFGAQNYPRIRQTIRYARRLSFSCAAVMWAAMVFAPRLLSVMFTDSQPLIDLTCRTMPLMFSTILALGFQMTNQNAFVAMGNTGYSFLFGIMRKILLLLPLAFLLPHLMGVWGVYAAEAISNPVTTVITFIVFERYMAGLKKRFSPGAKDVNR